MMEKISFKFSFSKNFNKNLQKCLNWINLKFKGLEWTKKKKVEGLKWILEKLRWKGLNILGCFYF